MNLADKIVMRPITALIPYASNARTLSEEFLGFLAENIGEARILMLATYRPGYRPPWIDKPYAGEVPVQPIGRGTVRRGHRCASFSAAIRVEKYRF